tara:strand:+ start:108 stop:290 length:183 start_codon:yes stop_codon:yes gene_type:complete
MYMGIYTVDPGLDTALYETIVGIEMKDMNHIKPEDQHNMKKVPSCDDLKKMSININMIKN